MGIEIVTTAGILDILARNCKNRGTEDRIGKD